MILAPVADSITLNFPANSFNGAVATATVRHPALVHFVPGTASIVLEPYIGESSADTLAQLQAPVSLKVEQRTDQYGAFAAPSMNFGVLSKSVGAAGSAVTDAGASNPSSLASASPAQRLVIPSIRADPV